MFLGTGKLEIRLMHPAGTAVKTIVPVRPSERISEDTEDVVTQLPQNAFGEQEEIFQAVRFRAVYRWISHKFNQSEMAKILEIGNWRGSSRFVNVWPHEDQPQLQFRCKVVRCSLVPLGGKTHGDVIELELFGLDKFANKPNPLYDRLGKVFRLGSIDTTARSFGS